ncbi:UvrD-helicase domain-containing protein [Streptosporangium sp. NBC_01810]|nr:UvrD-helicase domain-containing protein [Streptosporangium sp. NBC_01810]
MNQALENHALADAISTHIKTSIRALIVDEIFDANELDLRLVSMACEQDIKTTIIGDPWQALYAFRGATPELVHKLVSRYGFISCPLSESFRFRSPETILLAECLRARKPVELSAGEGEKVDVALAWKWQSLWSAGTEILPLSFGPPHTAAESAVALLLNQLTQVEFGLSSTFLNDALRNLGILDPAAPQRLFE